MQALLHEQHPVRIYDTITQAHLEAAELQLGENTAQAEPSQRWQFIVVPIPGDGLGYTIVVLDEVGLFVAHWI